MLAQTDKPKYKVNPWNSLDNEAKLTGALIYRPLFSLRFNIGSYWVIIPSNDVHTENCLQDIMLNHWTINKALYD